MNIAYLKEFETLAETGNFLEASEQLFISQSSLSKHIKSMETELGVPLFIRSTRKVSLSPFGAALLEDSKKITQLYMQSLEKLAKLREHDSSTLNIGAFSMLTSYGISDLLIGFSDAYPSIKTKLNKYPEPLLLRKLENGELDLAFIHSSPLPDDQFEKVLISRDCLCLVVPVTHPLAAKKSVSIGELKNEQFIIPPSQTLLNLYFQELSQQYQLPLDNALMVNDIYSIIYMVSREMGVSFLSRRSFVSLNHPNVVSIRLNPEYSTNVYLIYNRNSFSQPLYHFVNFVKSSVDSENPIPD